MNKYITKEGGIEQPKFNKASIKRKDMNTRRYYHTVETCLFCDATKEISDDCLNGAYLEKYGKCIWNEVYSKRVQDVKDGKKLNTSDASVIENIAERE